MPYRLSVTSGAFAAEEQTFNQVDKGNEPNGDCRKRREKHVGHEARGTGGVLAHGDAGISRIK